MNLKRKDKKEIEMACTSLNFQLRSVAFVESCKEKAAILLGEKNEVLAKYFQE